MEYHGLNQDEVNERIRHHQVNIVKDDRSKSYRQIIKDHTLTYFNALNIFLAFLIILSGKFVNMTFIGVVFVNTIIGIIQEFKVKSTIDQLKIVTTKHVKTFRDGELKDLNVDELVLDDVIKVEAGEQIACDLKVLETSFIEMNESLLTGESVPVVKKVDDEILAGTFVASGSAICQVIRVGNDVYSTKLSAKAKRGNKAASEMRDTIDRIIKVLSILIIPVGLLLFRSQYFANKNISNAIVKTVAGVVGMIPEGLVLLTSLSFVLGVGRLAKKRALVQQMEAIEALARVDVLCLDKTGTITTGAIHVEEVKSLHNTSNEAILNVMNIISFESDVHNATQEALKGYFTKQSESHVLDALPFSSRRKYSGYHLDNGKTYLLGAAEMLTKDPQILREVEDYAKNGLRVLMLTEAKDFEGTQIKEMALILMSDEIKSDAKETFDFFHQEDVSLRILSGDHPATVTRVLNRLGRQNIQAIDARELPDHEDELAKVVDHYQVFGRVKPEQKEMIVHAFQKSGHITGMVGDGVNDVLAIKEADCGIAMANGADAAKSAAHIVLMDSNFSSMIEIVKEGRTIIANIERVSSLYLTKTIYSACLSLLFGILGRVYPFTPFQLSIISGFAIGYPSFFIALEHDVKVSSKGFLAHVLKTALPCALTIVTYVTFLVIAQGLLGYSEKLFLSYSYIVTIFVSFIVLFKVCYPMNAYRLLIFLLCSVPVFFVVNFLSHYLSIYALLDRHMLYVLPVLASTIFVCGLYTRVINLFVKYHIVGNVKQRLLSFKK